jgi:hypothetical protein
MAAAACAIVLHQWGRQLTPYSFRARRMSSTVKEGHQDQRCGPTNDATKSGADNRIAQKKAEPSHQPGHPIGWQLRISARSTCWIRSGRSRRKNPQRRVKHKPVYLFVMLRRVGARDLGPPRPAHDVDLSNATPLQNVVDGGAEILHGDKRVYNGPVFGCRPVHLGRPNHSRAHPPDKRPNPVERCAPSWIGPPGASQTSFPMDR